MNPIIVIPARMESQRLPDKPLADIHGTPMIVHVWRQAMKAKCGPVVVAASAEAIAQAVRKAGGKAIVENGSHASGSDRIAATLAHLDPEERYDPVINLQGDMPTLDPALVQAVMEPFTEAYSEVCDISTLAAPLTDPSELDNSAVVKAVVSFQEGDDWGKALYFTRATAPWGEGPYYHHIGLYGYRRAALKKFVTTPPSPLEQREKLEQLRALEAGLKIIVRRVAQTALGVDTSDDLEKIRSMMA
ncbi:MAG: 3-deoxy-manno-octulosonate cytidylyltransferase [Parvularculales bacterium]